MGSDALGAGRSAVSILTDTGWLFRLMFGTEPRRCWIVCLPWRLCELGEAGCRKAGTLRERLTRQAFARILPRVEGWGRSDVEIKVQEYPRLAFLAHWGLGRWGGRTASTRFSSWGLLSNGKRQRPNIQVMQDKHYFPALDFSLQFVA